MNADFKDVQVGTTPGRNCWKFPIDMRDLQIFNVAVMVLLLLSVMLHATGYSEIGLALQVNAALWCSTPLLAVSWEGVRRGWKGAYSGILAFATSNVVLCALFMYSAWIAVIY